MQSTWEPIIYYVLQHSISKQKIGPVTIFRYRLSALIQEFKGLKNKTRQLALPYFVCFFHMPPLKSTTVSKDGGIEPELVASTKH